MGKLEEGRWSRATAAAGPNWLLSVRSWSPRARPSAKLRVSFGFAIALALVPPTVTRTASPNSRSPTAGMSSGHLPAVRGSSEVAQAEPVDVLPRVDRFIAASGSLAMQESDYQQLVADLIEWACR